MIGTKEICALLLAGSMGAGSVVAVQKAKPAISKPRPAMSKPKVQKAVQSQVHTSQITECPTVAPVGTAELSPFAATPTPAEPIAGFAGFASPAGVSGGGVHLPGGGGGNVPGELPDPSPVLGVPQPDTWVMLVAGFGFMGLALRRRSPGIRRSAD